MIHWFWKLKIHSKSLEKKVSIFLHQAKAGHGLIFEGFNCNQMLDMKQIMNFSRYFLLAGFISLLFISCGSSRKIVGLEEGWELLGDAKVNFIRDKDVIEVNSRNMFTAIRFSVEGKDIHLNDLKIELANGDVLKPAVDEEIKAGEQSRIIELAADGRTLKNIEFKYRSRGSIFKGRATVLVAGRRYDPYRRY